MQTDDEKFFDEIKSVSLGIGIGGSHFNWKSDPVKCSGLIHSVAPVYNAVIDNQVFTAIIYNMDSTKFILFGTMSTTVQCKIIYTKT